MSAQAPIDDTPQGWLRMFFPERRVMRRNAPYYWRWRTRFKQRFLTQRTERLPRFFASRSIPPNIGHGVTVEDRHHGLPRLKPLRHIPARLRFRSVEPLLEDRGPLDLDGIDGVLIGGESGLDVRPMHEA